MNSNSILIYHNFIMFTTKRIFLKFGHKNTSMPISEHRGG